MKISALILIVILGLSAGSPMYTQSLPLPYYTGFDTQQEQDSWEQYRLGIQSINDWGFGSSYACSSPTGLAHDYNVSGSGTDTVKDWFVSPALNLSTPSILSVKISPTMFYTKVGFFLSVGSKNPADGDYVELAEYELPYTVWNECRDTSVTISTVASNAYLAIRYVGSNYNAFGIDDISLVEQSQNYLSEGKSEITYFTISPNPTDHECRIALTGKGLINAPEIKITDMWGREVLHFEKITTSELFLKKEKIESGIYLINLYQQGKVIDKKRLVIQ